MSVRAYIEPILFMKRNLSFLFASLYAVSSVFADPVINEINYRPGTGYPENTALEFIEILNPDAAAVDVSGWQFTSGVSFTIPNGTILPAGGFLVVAANPIALQAAQPGLTGVFGPWAPGGGLSNKGEKITLSRPDALLPGALIKVDEVTYADEGDWAVRTREATFGGWSWVSLANSGDRTLELRNPAVANGNGQNWTASAAVGGTPGAANSVATANIAPIISGVKHAPAVPLPGQTVRVSCNLTDETAVAGLTAQVFWRDATSTSPGAFNSVPMTGDGSGEFAAILPAQTNLTIVEFYVSASDGINVRTWPAATNESQNANAAFQFDSEAVDTNDSMYRLILTGSENAAFTSVATSSDRQFNMTLVSSRGGETTIRYRSSMRIRGNSSRSYVYKPLRISIPTDDRWNGVSDFNLNPKYPYLQYIGMRLAQAAGLPASDSIPVEVRRNGLESTQGSSQAQDYGKWARVEDYSGDFVDNHFPTTAGGNLYKKGRPDEFWRSTSTAPTNPEGLLDGWTKQTNGSANDWTDIMSFFSTWQTAAAPHFTGASAGDVDTGTWAGTAFSASEMTSIKTAADLDQWARWFALMTLLQDNETNISNGQDDDYTIYIAPDGLGNRRVILLPHDFDTILGRGDSTLAANARGLFDATEEGSVFKSLLPLMGNTATAGNAEFRTKYFTAIRELCGGFMDANNSVNPNPPFYQFVDFHLGTWTDATVRTAIKNFMTTRQAHLLGLIGSGAITPPEPTSVGTVENIPGNFVIISEVLPNNVSAVNVGGVFPDAIELLNISASPQVLDGMSLSDDPAALKYTFPANTTLPAYGRIVIYADGTTAPGHAPFSLENDGETVYLRSSVASGAELRDSITYGPVPANYTVARTGGENEFWTLCTPTLGAANTEATLGSVAGVRINEWLGNADFRVQKDFLELYNPANLPVAIGGTRLTDNISAYPARHTLPPLSFMGAQSWLVFHGGNGSPTNATELPFNIDSTFGSLFFAGANGTIIDRVDIVAQFRNESTGRSPDGGTTLSTFGTSDANGTVLADLPTPGTANVTPTANLLALVNKLRITELNYKPVGGNNYEFIELQNTGTTTLDLSGVRFTNGISYTFPATTMLPAGQFIVVCRERTDFLSRYPSGASTLAPGQFTGALDNNGETITLSLPNPYDVAILSFTYKTTWQPLTFDAGHSLTVIAPATTNPRDWDEPETWTASQAPNGTPGSTGPPAITSTLTLSGVQGAPIAYQIAATNNPTSYSASGLPAGTAINTTTGLISGTPSGSGTFPITIGAANSAGSDSETLTLTLSPQPPPVITSPLSVTGSLSATFSYTITASNSATTFNATSLPAWLTFNPATATLSGLPSANGTYNVNISAGNLGGTDSKTLVITISADAFAAALDGFGLAYSTNGVASWIVQTTTTHDGVDAAQNGDISDSEETTLQTTVSGPDRLRFWWKVSSESTFDYLNFIVDGIIVERISGEVNWAQVVYDIPAGSHTVQWRYTKDGSVSTGTDSGYLDEVRLDSQSTEPIITSPLAVSAQQGGAFSYQIIATQNPQTYTATPLPAGLTLSPSGLISGIPTASGTANIAISASGPSGTANAVLVLTVTSSPASLAVGGDGVGLSWAHVATVSNSFWSSQSTTTHDGVDALKAGAIPHNGSTSFQVQLTGPGTLTFWWRVSSESSFDYLSYSLDGTVQASIAGEVAWAQRTLTIPSGAHTVLFNYSKDGSAAVGSDTGWIDEINFSPTDNDGDGLADAWEMTHFGSLAQNANGDADGDGRSNYSEYRFGTSPVSASSSTSISAATANPDGTWILDWNAVVGRIYGFEWSTDLVSWTPITTRASASATAMRATVSPNALGSSTVTLVADTAPAKAIGPASDIGTLWRGGNEVAFASAGGDTSWLSGTQGVGYENDTVPSGSNVPYTAFIGLDVKAQTFSVARTCVYVRIPFTVTNPAEFTTLQISLRADDGVAAFLNGVELATENAVASPAWNATTSSRNDSQSVVYRSTDVTAKLPNLRAGTNILALHGVNTSASSSDLLVQAILTGTKSSSPPPANSPKFFWRISAQ